MVDEGTICQFLQTGRGSGREYKIKKQHVDSRQQWKSKTAEWPLTSAWVISVMTVIIKAWAGGNWIPRGWSLPLDQTSGQVLPKGPKSKCLGLHRSYGLCLSYASLPLCIETPRVWMKGVAHNCSNKTLFGTPTFEFYTLFMFHKILFFF